MLICQPSFLFKHIYAYFSSPILAQKLKKNTVFILELIVSSLQVAVMFFIALYALYFVMLYILPYVTAVDISFFFLINSGMTDLLTVF